MQTIGIGTNPNDGTGDPIRTAFGKVNANFSTITPLGILANGARGSLTYEGSSGPAWLSPGTSGYVLQTNGAGADPTWAAALQLAGSGTATTAAKSDHTQAVGTLTQSGATTGQALAWSGSAWVPTTVTATVSPLGAPTVITTGSPTITLAGLNTFVRLTNTASVSALTLPNGTTDGQKIKLVISPTTQAHTLAFSLFGNSVTKSISSPNEGYTLEGYWCANDSTWYITLFDGGEKISDLTNATSLVDADTSEWQPVAGGPPVKVTKATLSGIIAAYLNKRQSVAYASTITPDISAGRNIDVGTLTGGITIAAPTNPPEDGGVVSFRFVQDGTGSRAVTWNSVFKGGSKSLSTAAGAVDRGVFQYRSATGFYEGAVIQNVGA